MAATDPIEISFVLNSKELEAEFKRIVSGAKNPDEAINALQEKFKQLNAAQLLGAKGMDDVVKAMKKMGDTAKSVKVDDFIVAKSELDAKKQQIKEVEALIKGLKKTASDMAPGNAQWEILAEVSSAESALKRYSNEVEEMESKMGDLKTSHEQLSTSVRKVKDEMAALQSVGKGNSEEYKELSKRAVEYQQALDRVNSEVKFLSQGGIQGMVQGLSAVAGGFSAAQGAVGLFAGESENLQKIMLKVQSLMAVTIGLQQISEALDKRSAFQVKFLTQAKAMFARVNTRVATSLHISNAAARALLGTLTLGLAVGIPLVINLFEKMATSASATARAQQKISDTAADSVSELLVNYKLLQKQWENTSGTLKEQQRFIDDNQDAFNKLGVSVNDVNDAQNIFVDNSDDFLVALMNQAKAAAAMQLSVDQLKKSLVLETEEKAFVETMKNGNWFSRGWAAMKANLGLVSESLGLGTFETSKDLEKESEDYLKMYQDFVDAANSIFEKLGISKSGKNRDKQRDEDKQTLADIIKEREDAWRQYYQYEAEFGRQAAKRQFEGIRQEADSFFDWLTNQRQSFADIITNGGTLTDEQRKDFEAITTKLAELSGTKSGFDVFTEGIEKAIAETPVLVDQLALLDAEIKKLEGDNRNIDNGRLNFLMGKREDVAGELSQLATEFIQAHQSIEQQKTEITARYAAIRTEIEAREMDEAEKRRLIREVDDAQRAEIEKLKEVEEEKENIFITSLQNITALTKRELGYRLEALEEYLEAGKAGLTEEEEQAVQAEIARIKSLREMKDLTSQEVQLLDQKKKLLKEISKLENNSDEKDAALKRLEKLNKEIDEIFVKKASEAAGIASTIASGFQDVAAAIGDSNDELSVMLSQLGNMAGVLSNAMSAAASFAMNDPIGGIAGSIGALSGLIGMVSGGKSLKDLRREREIAATQAGLDYNQMLRERLMLLANINEAYRSRLMILQDEIKAAELGIKSILEDQEEIIRKLLKSQTLVSTSNPWAPVVGVDIGTLLGLPEGDQGWLLFLDDIEGYLTMLEELNAAEPFEGMAAVWYQELLDLIEEMGGLEAFIAQAQQEQKNILTGTTAQGIADSIIEGIRQGKRSFEDFGNDIEGILRNAILAGLDAKLMNGRVQLLQDLIYDKMLTGSLTEDDINEIREMWEGIINEAVEFMDILDQTGLDLFGPGQDLNSLQGAYKAASQESIDLLSGNTAALRLSVIEGNGIFQNGFSAMLQAMSSQLEVQMNIENNTLTIATNTQKLYSIDAKLGQIQMQGGESIFSGTGLNP